MSNEGSDEELDGEIRDLIAGKDDDVAGSALTSFLICAIHDEHPEYTLQRLTGAVIRTGAAQILDPLSVIPLLLRCRKHGVAEMLTLLGECGNAKENLIAIQESVERFIDELQRDEDGDEETSDDQGHSTMLEQLMRMLSLYSSTFPRLKLRKKSPAETLRSCLKDLEEAFQLVGPSLSHSEGRATLREVTYLISVVAKWVHDQVPNEALDTLEPARSLLLSVLTSLAPHLDTEMAQRLFEAKYPRLVVRSAVKEDGNIGVEFMLETVGVARLLWPNLETLLQERSFGMLVLIAHDFPPSIPPNQILETTLPLLISSIRSNIVLDKSLFILLSTLHTLYISKESLSSEIAPILSSLLASVACAHPQAPTRHLTFRILSLVLSCSLPVQRIHLFHDLLSDSSLPQMQIAAVGLLKNEVLGALNDNPANSPFASPDVLRAFGSIVFRPDPPDLFDSTELSLETFVDTPESKRLVECLAFYYVLIMRDKDNATGIRDKDQIKSIETALLASLRSTIQRWMNTVEGVTDIMPLAALATSLERVDSALVEISK